MRSIAWFFSLYYFLSLLNSSDSADIIKWCASSESEFKKCNALSTAIADEAGFKALFTLECVQGRGEFDCMQAVKDLRADVMNLDAGLAFYASRDFSLRPIAVENYGSDNAINNLDLSYFATIVVPKSKPNIDPFRLRGEEICFSGAGMADGWIMQLSHLLGEAIKVEQCNSVVQNLIGFLGDSCIPGALSQIFNPFGDNTEEICRLCKNRGTDVYCTYNDEYARNQGALKCLHEHNNNIETKSKPTAAFIRAQEIQLAALDGFPINDYLLLCPTKQADGLYTAPIDDWENCNWGKVPSRMIMTSLTNLNIQVERAFFRTLLEYFGTSMGPFPNATGTALPGIAKKPFELFSSKGYAVENKPSNPSHHLMFSDFTRTVFVPTESDISSYYRWMRENAPDFLQKVENLNQCPLLTLRWCVLDEWEMNKCQTMRNAFAVKSIKPDLDCIRGNNTAHCMQLIKDGYVDMMDLDAGDLYSAGKYFGLVPIVAEYYGIGPYYYAVAAVLKINPLLLISNWKYSRTCHSGVGKATGWIVPLNTIMDTVQVRVLNGRLIYSLGELVSRACIPGILDNTYNPTNDNSINLCEICAAGGDDRCQRDNRELYYGEAGAFRCLVESGDIAFMRHTTIYTNTAGRNPNYWARNLREDNYELLCADGQRKDVSQWQTCNLGRIPGNVIVTAPYKTENDRRNMWRMLQYGQEYYAKDTDPIFSMFDSGFDHKDLLFSDDTESLKLIPWEDQEYTKWLGPEFLRLVENIDNIGKGPQSGIYNAASSARFSPILLSFIFLLLTLLLSFELRS